MRSRMAAMSRRALIILVAVTGLAVAPSGSDASPESLPDAVAITIDQEFEYRKASLPEFHSLEDFELPLLDYAEDLLLAADIEPLDDGAGGGGWELRVSLTGRALGRLYIDRGRTYLYTGADLAGEVAVSGPGASETMRPFSSTIERPFEVLIDHGYEKPENAPFLETLVKPDGFLEALVNVMIDVWGVVSVLPALDEPGHEVRFSVVSALGRTSEPAVVTALIEALEDEHERVRWEAAWSLGRIGDGRAVPHLIEALQDTSQDVRWFSSWSLRTITGADIGPDYDQWTAWWSNHGGDASG